MNIENKAAHRPKALNSSSVTEAIITPRMMGTSDR